MFSTHREISFPLLHELGRRGGGAVPQDTETWAISLLFVALADEFGLR